MTQPQGTSAADCTCADDPRSPHHARNCIKWRCGHSHSEYAIVEVPANGDFSDDTCASLIDAAKHHHDPAALVTGEIMCDSGKLTCGYVGLPHVAECWGAKQ